jgi:hypothetical protein
MSMLLTSLVVVATLATVATLVMGLWSMVYNHGDSSPIDDEHWMIYRVVLQAVALAALVATFFVGK